MAYGLQRRNINPSIEQVPSCSYSELIYGVYVTAAWVAFNHPADFKISIFSVISLAREQT